MPLLAITRLRRPVARDHEDASVIHTVPSNIPSDHEIAVLRALVKYGTICRAAEALCLSPHTVDSHLDRLRAKSGHRYLCQIIAWAALSGWLTAEDEVKI